MGEVMSLRERTRGAVRDEVMRQAWALFASQGFEATTIDQIAEAAGMSRRSFFRYFESKDELVLEQLAESGRAVAAALAARPGGESAWVALRAAFDESITRMEAHPEKSHPLQVMLHHEPALRSTVVQWRRRLVGMLSPIVAERLGTHGGRGADVRATAVTASALACLDAAQGAWALDGDLRLSTLLDQAMGAVAPLD